MHVAATKRWKSKLLSASTDVQAVKTTRGMIGEVIIYTGKASGTIAISTDAAGSNVVRTIPAANTTSVAVVPFNVDCKPAIYAKLNDADIVAEITYR